MKVGSEENCIDVWRLVLQICWEQGMPTVMFSEGVFSLCYVVMTVQI